MDANIIESLSDTELLQIQELILRNVNGIEDIDESDREQLRAVCRELARRGLEAHEESAPGIHRAA